ncbi:hypothetical protein LR48_Vigan10g285400 [Vigna angularis]|uniref:S-protein homolog n=1 Tax=Phaseolus angularis TaxID=3914 RepID=A0A0L9VQ11_PHAAN|nr:hypothetical protein LR48_Vigan10g285400 [Vigna angularis]
MMDSISKMMRILCWLLILASELRRSESSDQFLPHSVAVKIANMLTLKQLTLHCRDKNHDLGIATINVGESFVFYVNPNFFLDKTLYYCRFIWKDANHRFDIYVQHRDHVCNNNVCSWQIFEKRPCDVSFGVLVRKCYVWPTNNTLSS